MRDAMAGRLRVGRVAARSALTLLRRFGFEAVVVLVLVVVLVWAGLWVRDATFDFVYGDAARELIREMVKPEALKVDP